MTMDKEQNMNNNEDLKKIMDQSEDKLLSYVPYESSLTPALCGFQLLVSGQIHFFWCDSEKQELIHLTWTDCLSNGPDKKERTKTQWTHRNAESC